MEHSASKNHYICTFQGVDMDISKFIAGKYVKQYKYNSFLPEPVNHVWNINDPVLNKLLSEADLKLGELNAFSQLIPNVDFFIKMHITKEATQSSRIEGTKTNIEEALRGKLFNGPVSRRWVRNYSCHTLVNFNTVEVPCWYGEHLEPG